MKPSLLLYSLILIAPVIESKAQPAQPQGATLYVAPGGKDAAAGTQAEPLASLAGARDRVRQLKQEVAAGEPITVVFADGTYELAEAVVFGPQDSGAEKAPVTYRAEHSGKVIFSGGSRVTGWTLKGEGVWAAPIESGRDFYQFFVNGERRQRARTPNSGYLKSFGPARPVANFEALDKKDLGYHKQFRFRDQDFQNWPDLADALVISYHSWLVSLHWIDRIDPSQGIVTLRNPAGWPFGNWDNQQERYIIENLKSAFDAPGEWYLDKAAGELLYRPLPGEDMAKAEAVAPVGLRLLELDNVEHLAFEGISLRYSDWRLDKDAFRDQQAFANVDSAPIFGRKLRHSRFENCEIALAGAHAIVLREGCQDNVIRQCHIHDMAGGGIYLGPVSAIRPNTPEVELAGHNTVDNCFIHNLNHTFHGAVGILIGHAADNSITHNDISEFDYTGISGGWTWDRATNTHHRNNRIEKNRIHHLMQGVLSDGGGIYTTGYLNAGTVVRGNVVHDIHHHLTHCSAKGIYLDGNSSDIVVENNLCYDISSLGIQTKGERNQILNNIFAFCGVAGLSRGRQDQKGIYTHEANLYARNIVYVEHPVMASGEVEPALSRFEHQLYWNRSNPLNAVFINGSADGAGTRVSEDSDGTGRELGQAESSLVADPGFVNPEQRDFRLKPGSPAEKIGFVPFDFSDAGLYGDPAWTARPAQLAHRPLETVEPDWLAFRYDFEDHHEGMTPMSCWGVGENNGCTVRVSSDQAASGTKSLLFEDGAEAPSYVPMLSIKRPYADGRYRLSLKLWQDPANPAELTLGTRSYTGAKYLTGVQVKIGTDGALFAGTGKLGTVPQGEWITLELSFGSGAEHAASYDVSAVLPDGTRLEAAQVPVADAAFQKLGWIGVIASGKTGRLYLDDLELSAGAAMSEAALLLAPLAALHAADPTTPDSKVAATATPGTTLESRGLPLSLFNNDGEDLSWPAYPEPHTEGLWDSRGNYMPMPKINSLDDVLVPRIGPLAKTKTQGLSFCGNFGMSVWDLKRDHIAALGDDPLQPILQFWKQGGRKFLFSVRMNDLHHVWLPPWPQTWNEFRRTHRDLWFKPPTDGEWETQFLPWLNGTGPKPVFAKDTDLLLDYSKPQVREHYLDIVREACRRYDLDGIELDWLRFPELFRRGEVDAATLTAFVAEARSILDESAKRRGHPLRLVARVPDSPADARSRGMDVEAWLKKGLLDAVIAGGGLTYSANKLEEWVALAHRYQTPVYGSMERMFFEKKSFSRFGTPETLRAAAATLWEKGADGLYFFNFYVRDEMPRLDEWTDRTRLAQLPKEYFVDAYFGGSHSNGPLPLTLKPGTPATVRLVIGDDPATLKATSLELVFKAEGQFEPPAITLNGQPLNELKTTRGKAEVTLTLSSSVLKQALKRGTNEFSFTSPASATLTALSVRVEP